MKKLLLSLFVCGGLGTAAQAQIVNPGMEAWQDYTAGFPPMTFDRPTGWYSADSIVANLSLLLGFTPEQQLTQSTDFHSGSFAARIETSTQGLLGNIPGLLMNAEPEIDIMDSSFTFNGGTPITGWVDSLYGWVKYSTPGLDSGQMSGYAFKSGAGEGGVDSMVGSGTVMIGPAGSYEEVSLKMNYTSTLQPDKIVIVFSSSPFNSSSALGSDALPGSTLLVDDVSMVMSMLSVPTVHSGSDKIRVFPNPATDVLHMDAATVSGAISLAVYNTAGQKVAAQVFTGQTAVNTAELPAGTYLYLLRDSKGQLIKNGKFLVAR